MNDDIRAWIDEVKHMKKLDEIQKEQLIGFDNYFKYSGEIEEDKKITEFKNNEIKFRKIVIDDPVIQFYFDVPGYTLKEIAQVFGVQESVVSGKLDKYFNNKKLKHGKHIKNE